MPGKHINFHRRKGVKHKCDGNIAFFPLWLEVQDHFAGEIVDYGCEDYEAQFHLQYPMGTQ